MRGTESWPARVCTKQRPQHFWNEDSWHIEFVYQLLDGSQNGAAVFRDVSKLRLLQIEHMGRTKLYMIGRIS